MTGIRERVTSPLHILAKKSRYTETGSEKGSAELEFPHHRGVSLAASFLRDYEANRPPTLDGDVSHISEDQLMAALSVHHPFMKTQRCLACLCFFFSCCFEGFSDHDRTTECRIFSTLFNFLGVIILSVDVYLHRFISPTTTCTNNEAETETNEQQLGQIPPPRQPQRKRHQTHAVSLIRPIIIFGSCLVLENFIKLLVTDRSIVLWTSFAKPLVLFYVSQRARDAFQALRRVIRIVLRVIAMELLLILMFSAVAVRLFPHDESFRNLSVAWFSLFQQSTTVTNPSVWMNLYAANKSTAIFFIVFICICVFYLHSLVLSVVFSAYLKAASKVHSRSSADREDAVRLAFHSLLQEQGQRQDSESEPLPKETVSVDLIEETLCQLRPHYGVLKINTLVEILDPAKKRVLDFPTFRTRIRQALNASIRTARISSRLSIIVELVGMVVAAVNFVYVILVTSAMQSDNFITLQQAVGTLITLLAAGELLLRLNPCKILNFTPRTRLNPTFDGLALVAALVSVFGIVVNLRVTTSFDCMLMGRALDMLRIMKFFPTFRDIVWRSTDILPALIGPLILVVSTLHLFVYLGMAFWGGAVHVGAFHDDNDDDAEAVNFTRLYDLYNFNSYLEGAVTMFQILVVNDWHTIATVFLYADRCANPILVHSFFIAGNLLCVSIMLNVLTAFFVQTFAAKMEHSDHHPQRDNQKNKAEDHDHEQDFSIHTSENSAMRRVSSECSLHYSDGGEIQLGNHDRLDKGGPATDDYFEFDVYEREGFDTIMKTVARGASTGEESNAGLASKYSHLLEILAGLQVSSQNNSAEYSCGYLIWDQQSLTDHSSTPRFYELVSGIEGVDRQAFVRSLHEELTQSQGVPITRSFAAMDDGVNHRVEISASLVHPTVSLLVARSVKNRQPVL